MPTIKGRYARIEIPLDKAETGKELFLTGDYLSIISIAGEGTCKIKLDHRHSQTLNLREISKISGFFERIYLTTDGAGGTCTLYIGTGIAIDVETNPEEMWGGGTAGAHATAPLAAVQPFADAPYRLYDVTIKNVDASWPCYVGPYNSDRPTFISGATMLRGKEELRFRKKDMSSLGCTSWDGIHTVEIHIIGTFY